MRDDFSADTRKFRDDLGLRDAWVAVAEGAEDVAHSWGVDEGGEPTHLVHAAAEAGDAAVEGGGGGFVI